MSINAHVVSVGQMSTVGETETHDAVLRLEKRGEHGEAASKVSVPILSKLPGACSLGSLQSDASVGMSFNPLGGEVNSRCQNKAGR